MSVWPTIARFIAEHGASVLVTMAESRGSSPRDAGARMVVRPDGGFSGTIGGGALEWIALAEAQVMLASGNGGKPFRKIDKALGPDLGQCCGGRVTLTLERFDAHDSDWVGVLAAQERHGLATLGTMQDGRLVRRVLDPAEFGDVPHESYLRLPDGRVVERFGAVTTPLYLFGAGHVGRALVLALAPLPFAVTWIDPRPDAFPAHIPANVTCVADAEPVKLLADAPDDALIAVMTHSHALDLDLVMAALRAKRFAYVGLIGSETKRARFSSTMRKLGFTHDDINRLTCPIGLTDITDKSPAAIAASIAAQLLIVRESIVRARASGDGDVGIVPDLTGATMLDPSSLRDSPGSEPLLRAIAISKAYGTFLANDEIDLDLWPQRNPCAARRERRRQIDAGQDHLRPDPADAGRIALDGTQSRARGTVGSARARHRHGVPAFLAVREPHRCRKRRARPGADRIIRRDFRPARRGVARYGLPLDPKREVWRLSVGERQRIEIVRALMQNPKLLILDEPTAVLTPQEADQLFIMLERLREEGRAILYISHKLDEVKRLCDTATILRGGKKIATCNPREETAASLARMMVGADIGEVKAASDRARGLPRLMVHDLSLEPDDPHGMRLANVSLEVCGGEILGIAGVAGNGQDELFSALSGERLAPGTGDVVIDGQAAGQLSITERRRLGAAFVPEERLGHGTAPRMQLSDNALLTGHAASGMVHHGFIDKGATLSTVDRTTTTFDVRKAKRDPEAVSLSGGNLQKFVVGREILREPGVLVVSQPTWGVDAGAAAVIRQALIDLAARGAAVLVISQDLDELFEIADRIAVMFSRPPVGADRCRRRRPRDDRPADGRQQQRRSGGDACSWCLSGAPSARPLPRSCRR